MAHKIDNSQTKPITPENQLRVDVLNDAIRYHHLAKGVGDTALALGLEDAILTKLSEFEESVKQKYLDKGKTLSIAEKKSTSAGLGLMDDISALAYGDKVDSTEIKQEYERLNSPDSMIDINDAKAKYETSVAKIINSPDMLTEQDRGTLDQELGDYREKLSARNWQISTLNATIGMDVMGPTAIQLSISEGFDVPIGEPSARRNKKLQKNQITLQETRLAASFRKQIDDAYADCQTLVGGGGGTSSQLKEAEQRLADLKRAQFTQLGTLDQTNLDQLAREKLGTFDSPGTEPTLTQSLEVSLGKPEIAEKFHELLAQISRARGDLTNAQIQHDEVKRVQILANSMDLAEQLTVLTGEKWPADIATINHIAQDVDTRIAHPARMAELDKSIAASRKIIDKEERYQARLKRRNMSFGERWRDTWQEWSQMSAQDRWRMVGSFALTPVRGLGYLARGAGALAQMGTMAAPLVGDLYSYLFVDRSERRRNKEKRERTIANERLVNAVGQQATSFFSGPNHERSGFILAA